MTFALQVHDTVHFNVTTTFPTLVPTVEFPVIWRVTVTRATTNKYYVSAQHVIFPAKHYEIVSSYTWRQIAMSIYVCLFKYTQLHVEEWNDTDARSGDDGQTLADAVIKTGLL